MALPFGEKNRRFNLNVQKLCIPRLCGPESGSVLCKTCDKAERRETVLRKICPVY